MYTAVEKLVYQMSNRPVDTLGIYEYIFNVRSHLETANVAKT